MLPTHVAGMIDTRNTGVRPPDFQAPAHLSPSPPVPQPAEAEPQPEPGDRLPPTRYGDWEHNGIAIDF